MIAVPFLDWLIPRDPPLSQDELLERQRPSRVVMKPADEEPADEKPADKEPKRDGRSTGAGSWMVSHDDWGYPFWTNDATGEATYGLFLEQSARGPTIKHVLQDHAQRPLRAFLPLPLPEKARARRDGCCCRDGGGGGGDGGDGRSSGGCRKEKKKKKKGGRGRSGFWEEIYDAVDGTKTWRHTGTKKTTNVDPFW